MRRRALKWGSGAVLLLLGASACLMGFVTGSSGLKKWLLLPTKFTEDIGLLAFSCVGFVLPVSLALLFYSAWRRLCARLDAPSDREGAPAEERPRRAIRTAGTIEKTLLVALCAATVGLCANGFGQLAVADAKLYARLLDGHIKLGAVLCAVMAAHVFLWARRLFSWKLTLMFALFPAAFIWASLLPTAAFTLAALNGVMFPGCLLWLALNETARERRAEAVCAGVALYGFSAAALTGAFSIFDPVEVRFSFNHRILHAWTAPAALLPAVWFALRRGGAGQGRRAAALLCFALAVGIAVGGALRAGRMARLAAVQKRAVWMTADLAKRDGLEFRELPAGALGGNGDCAACHDVAHRQWEASVHAFAARTMPFVKTAARLMEKHGPEFVRLCATCHDPAVACSDDPSRIADPVLALESEGVSCKACHYMSRAEGKNALYALALPRTETEWTAPADRFRFIRMAALEHVSDVTKPAGRDGTACFPCHLLESKRGGEIKIPLDNVTSFHGSKFSGIMPCHQCHMPRIESKARYAYAWLDHRFFGIQQDLPSVALLSEEDRARLGPELERNAQATGEWLRGELKTQTPRASVTDDFFKSYRVRNLREAVKRNAEIAAVAQGGSHFFIDLESSSIADGEAALEVSALNRNVSHNFPSSLFANVTEAWLELDVVDAGGRRIYFEGWNERDLSRRLGRVEVDARGIPVDPEDSLKYVDIVNDRFIEPERKLIERFRFKAPADYRAPLTVRCRLMYRRYSDEFVKWFSDGGLTSLPARAVGEGEFTIGPAGREAKREISYEGTR